MERSRRVWATGALEMRQHLGSDNSTYEDAG